MSKYIIQGGKPLEGKVSVGGSKNAVLPLMAACLLTKEEVTLTNVPGISDIAVMAEIIQGLGGKVEIGEGTLKIQVEEITSHKIDTEHAKKIRTSILFMSGLLARAGEVETVVPGGDKIGKRPIDTHIKAFQDLGAEILKNDTELHLKTSGLQGAKIRLMEMSVTGVENAIIAAVTAKGTTEIRLAPTEPHVQDLCTMLNNMGAKISGVGTNILTIEGVDELHGTTHAVTPDYLETGTFVMAALVTKGHVIVENIVPDHLDILWNYLDQMGAKYTLGASTVEIFPTEKLTKVKRVRTSVYPDFPTDLIAPMAVLLTQVEGINKIFETLYEARLNYVVELEKMGAHAEILNAHEAVIVGPTQLHGATVASWDLRAGTAMVLAGLAAQGTTEVTEIHWIDRGYEHLHKKLQDLGANIVREE